MSGYKGKIYQKYVTNGQALIGSKSGQLLNRCDFIKIKKLVKSFLPADKDISIVDLGCGSGRLMAILKKLGYLNITGVETSEEQINLAKALGVSEVIQGDIRSFLKDKEKCYDVIFLMNVLEHFTKTEGFEILEEIFKASKEKACVVIRVPNGEGIFGGRAFFGDFTHEVCFTSQSIGQVLRTIGFSEILFQEEAPVIHGVFSFARWIIWKMFSSFMRAMLMAETGPEKYILSQNITIIAKKQK